MSASITCDRCGEPIADGLSPITIRCWDKLVPFGLKAFDLCPACHVVAIAWINGWPKPETEEN